MVPLQHASQPRSLIAKLGCAAAARGKRKGSAKGAFHMLVAKGKVAKVSASLTSTGNQHAAHDAFTSDRKPLSHMPQLSSTIPSGLVWPQIREPGIERRLKWHVKRAMRGLRADLEPQHTSTNGKHREKPVHPPFFVLVFRFFADAMNGGVSAHPASRGSCRGAGARK